jgi:hypothetical protein
MDKVFNGCHIGCWRCQGHGLITSMSGEPDECYDCGGSGLNWVYPSGRIARYYSGPFIGYDPSSVKDLTDGQRTN